MNILTNQELAERLNKKQADLTWWENKLAKSRKAGKIATRALQRASLKNLQINLTN